MQSAFSAVIWGGLASASLLIGYFLSWRGLPEKIVGLIMATGAGALISAIAYELIPESQFDSAGVALLFVLGAVVFFFADLWIDNRGGQKRKSLKRDETEGSGAAIFIGTLMDNIPESIILGIGMAYGGAINLAFLVAVFISNLPEGLAGTINLFKAGYTKQKIFMMWIPIVLISAFCAGLGYFLIITFPAADGRYIQAFAAGAMLTMLTEAMIPEAYQHGGKLAGLFTVFGFLVAAVLSILQ